MARDVVGSMTISQKDSITLTLGQKSGGKKVVARFMPRIRKGFRLGLGLGL